MQETWLILGAGSPVGRAMARYLAAGDARLILAGPDKADLEASAADISARYPGVPAEALHFDATKTGTHKAFSDRVAARAEGSLNVVVLFAFQPPQEEAQQDIGAVKTCMDVTLTGVISVLHELVVPLTARPGSRVGVFGSVAGDRGRPSNYVYGAAKAGLHAFLQGFRARMWTGGVTVTTIKPGFMDTHLTWGKSGVFLAAPPEKAAKAALRHIREGRPVACVPFFWWGIMAIIKSIPERIFRRLSL